MYNESYDLDVLTMLTLTENQQVYEPIEIDAKGSFTLQLHVPPSILSSSGSNEKIIYKLNGNGYTTTKLYQYTMTDCHRKWWTNCPLFRFVKIKECSKCSMILKIQKLTTQIE